MSRPAAVPSGPERPRVAYVLPDPGIPVGGTKGASVHVDALCGAMARIGTSVTLYAPKVVGPLVSVGSETVRVVPIDAGSVRSGPDGERDRIESARRFFAAVGDALDADPPDWIHERLSLFAGDGAPMAAARSLPRLVEVNAPVADERRTHVGLRLVDDAHAAERAALAGARVAAVSGPLAAWALGCGAAEATVVPNGADTGERHPERWARYRAPLRRLFGFSDATTVIGFAGSLKPWHGVENLVTAMAAAHGELGLLIVGDGPRRAVVEESVTMLPSGVRAVCTGAVPAAEVPRYLAAMDVAAAPYLPSSGFYFSPLKIAEAMAAGLPVVASDFPPVRELLGSTGVLVPPGEVGSLAGALSRLAADPPGRARLGAAGRARAVDRLDWESVARRTVALVDDGRVPNSRATA